METCERLGERVLVRWVVALDSGRVVQVVVRSANGVFRRDNLSVYVS